MKWVVKHKQLQTIWSQIKQFWVILIHMKLWVAVAIETQLQVSENLNYLILRFKSKNTLIYRAAGQCL